MLVPYMFLHRRSVFSKRALARFGYTENASTGVYPLEPGGSSFGEVPHPEARSGSRAGPERRATLSGETLPDISIPRFASVHPNPIPSKSV